MPFPVVDPPPSSKLHVPSHHGSRIAALAVGLNRLCGALAITVVCGALIGALGTVNGTGIIGGLFMGTLAWGGARLGERLLSVRRERDQAVPWLGVAVGMAILTLILPWGTAATAMFGATATAFAWSGFATRSAPFSRLLRRLPARGLVALDGLAHRWGRMERAAWKHIRGLGGTILRRATLSRGRQRPIRALPSSARFRSLVDGTDTQVTTPLTVSAAWQDDADDPPSSPLLTPDEARLRETLACVRAAMTNLRRALAAGRARNAHEADAAERLIQPLHDEAKRLYGLLSQRATQLRAIMAFAERHPLDNDARHAVEEGLKEIATLAADIEKATRAGVLYLRRPIDPRAAAALRTRAEQVEAGLRLHLELATAPDEISTPTGSAHSSSQKRTSSSDLHPR